MPRRSLHGTLTLLVFLTTTAGAPQHAQAHEVRPGYLELTAVGGDVWDVLWKVPTKAGKRLGLYVRLPVFCDGSEPIVQRRRLAYIERWRATCTDALVGESISIEGLALTRTDVLVRVKHADGTTQTARLTSDRPGFEVTSSPRQLEVAKTYLLLGVEHILGGIDHLLFVLALLFLVGDARKLVATITAFTAAHSLTLVAATLGWLRVPSAPVEAVIALSIVFVAAEILRDSDSAGLAKRKPWLVALAFGLLHGLGFAGALSDVGLPSHAIPVALAFFNIGVEAGQLIFIAAALSAFVIARLALRIPPSADGGGPWAAAEVFATPAAYSIGIAGAFWLIERTLSF